MAPALPGREEYAELQVEAYVRGAGAAMEDSKGKEEQAGRQGIWAE